MKKILFFVLAAALFASCSYSRILSTTRTLDYKEHNPITVTDIIADLEVSEVKVNYLYIPTRPVNNAGYQNVIRTAIREALIANGNADVFVGLDTQIKVNSDNKIETITVSGYPAKYINFRSVDEKYILELSKLYMDLNLKLNYNVGENPVPNIIPDIRPEVTSGEGKIKGMFPSIEKTKKRRRK